MAGCSRSIVFDFDSFDSYRFEQVPKGDFMTFGVNPYNGRVFVRFQGNLDDKRCFVERAFEQFAALYRAAMFGGCDDVLLDLERMSADRALSLVDVRPRAARTAAADKAKDNEERMFGNVA